MQCAASPRSLSDFFSSCTHTSVKGGCATHEGQNGQSGSVHYSERAFGAFCRRFTLGTAVDADKITATYKAGVLEVHIPKTAAAQPKRIAVQSAA